MRRSECRECASTRRASKTSSLGGGSSVFACAREPSRGRASFALEEGATGGKSGNENRRLGARRRSGARPGASDWSHLLVERRSSRAGADACEQCFSHLSRDKSF